MSPDYSVAMWQCQPTPTARFAAYFAVFLLFVCPRAAKADGAVWAGAGLANLTTLNAGGVLGPGVQLGGSVGIGEFFAITADVVGSHHFENRQNEIPSDRVLAASLGIRYNFDVFKYVPYAGLAAAAYLDAPSVSDAPVNANAGGKLFLGVDWRFHRNWSFGPNAELHTLLTDLSRFPVFTFIGVNVAHHFRF